MLAPIFRHHLTQPNTGQNFAPSDVSVNNTVSVTGSVATTVVTSASFTTSQVTITSSTTATLIFAANASIVFKEIISPTSSNAICYIGSTSSVTTLSGHALVGLSAMDWNNNSAAIYAVTATGSVTVSTMGW